MKPGFRWLELGLFSGDGENADQALSRSKERNHRRTGLFGLCDVTCRVQRAALDVAGCSHRAAGGWYYVVNDVNYLKDKNNPADVRLSKLLSDGCNGPRWVGEGTRPR